MFQSAFTWLSETIHNILERVLNILPDSPFVVLNKSTEINTYLSYINWIVPLNFMISTLQAWLVAIASYYIWSLILRWIKAID